MEIFLGAILILVSRAFRLLKTTSIPSFPQSDARDRKEDREKKKAARNPGTKKQDASATRPQDFVWPFLPRGLFRVTLEKEKERLLV